jgi:glycosyltransferase involved in cell wall biosynthesis
MPSPDKSLRVLTVTHNYPRFSGDPAGAFVARIAAGAASRGHEVLVVAPHAEGLPVEERSDSVRVHRFRYAPARLERVAYTGNLHQGTLRFPLAALAFPGFLIAFGRAVRDAVRRFQPDVIHAHWWVPGGWFARRWGVPYVVTCHGSDVRLLERGELIRKAGAGVFRRAARVTAVSGFLARDIERLSGGLAAGVVVTPMPVDVAAFQAGIRVVKAEPPRILYAGNLVRSKGVDILLNAAAELERRGLAFQLKILGQGPAQDELQALAQALGIAPRVTWSRFVPQSEMPAEYGASTITVLPTRGAAEGLGLTLVEALLSGSAVVGTSAGGIPEVVQDEQTGLIARDGDPGHLATQIQRLLVERPLRERLTAAGREHAVRTYAPDVAIERFLQIYHAAARDQPQR